MRYLTHLLLHLVLTYRTLTPRLATAHPDPLILVGVTMTTLAALLVEDTERDLKRVRRIRAMYERRYAGEGRLKAELKLTGRMCQLLFVLIWREVPTPLRIVSIILVVLLVVASTTPAGLMGSVVVVFGKWGRESKGDGYTRILDLVDASPMTNKIEEARFNGRHGYSPKVMWRAVLASYVLDLPSTNALIRRLEEDPHLRETCGFGETLPHRTTFNRFFTRLADYQTLVDKCLADLVHQFRELLPGLGEKVAVDSTPVRSHSHPRRKGKLTRKTSDPQANWTAKPSDRRKGEKDWFWGYKLHLMVDAVYGIPLYCYTTTASMNDSPELPKMLAGAKETLNWLNPKRVMADRGYDSQANHEAVLDRGGVLISPVRLPSSDDKLHEGIYTVKGEPTCMGVVPMVYERSDPELGHLYRCRREGCHLLGKKGRRYCNQEFWVNRSDNVRLFGPIRRDSAEWDGLYVLRQSVERAFKSLKENRRLERHSFRGLRRVGLHAAMSVLGFAATMLVKLLAQEINPTWMVRKVA